MQGTRADIVEEDTVEEDFAALVEEDRVGAEVCHRL
jgi:hypothetical protein